MSNPITPINLEEGAFVIVGRSPFCPWWEYVFTDNPSQPFQEIKDPNRKDSPLVFLYRSEAQECLNKILEIKLQRGLMQGAEVRIISSENLLKPVLKTDLKPPEWYRDL